VRSRSWIAVIVLAVAACGSDDTDGGPNTSAPATGTVDAAAAAPPVGLRGEVVLTRQRDLVDRGFVNVMTTNATGGDVVVLERQLVADHFETEPSPVRNSTLRRGRDVALKVPYGDAVDCSSTDPVRAWLRIEYTTEATPTPVTADVPLAGTDVLEDIRARQCTTREFETAVDLTLDDVVVRDDVVAADLVLSRTGAQPAIVVEQVAGTVLFGVGTPTPVLPVAVGSSGAVIPVEFRVNRCDPHALAEVTKRHGLRLDVALDGRAPQPVEVDVTDVIDDLDEILARCMASATS
jgi:hypothetical protein